MSYRGGWDRIPGSTGILGVNSTDQRAVLQLSTCAQQDGQNTISRVIYYGPRFSCYAMAVKLAFGSPHDEVLDGYIECDLLNNTLPGLALIIDTVLRIVSML